MKQRRAGSITFLLLWIGLFCIAWPLVSVAERAGETTKNVDEGASGSTIKVGAIFARTGFAAVHNTPIVELTQLAVEQINSQGGVLGKQLELIVIDNASTPIGAKKAALEAVELGVVGVIGAHWSSHSLAVAPILQEAGIPMISPASTHPDVTQGKNYVFRACFLDSAQGEAMAGFATGKLGVKTAVILRNVDEIYCNRLADYFLYSFIGHGGEILLDASYRGLATDFTEIIDQILELRPDSVYIPGYTRDSALFMKQARRKGVKAVFLGGDGWDILERLVADAVEGSYQTVHWHPDVPYPKSHTLKELYKDIHGRDLDYLTSPLAYDAVLMLAEAIEKAGEAVPAGIRNALASMKDFEGATGRWSFDEQGNPVGKDVIITTYRNGEIKFFDVVEPY